MKKKYFRTAMCKKCGKEFIPAPYHIYKHNSKFFCSWTCYNHRDDKPEIEIQNIFNKEEFAYEGD